MPSFSSVMFWTYDHKAILYTGLRLRLKLLHWNTAGTFNASRNKGIFLFSTRKSALNSAGSLFASEKFHTSSEEKEDYSACILRKAEQTFLRL